ncbi:MAG: ornithine carbamoyltransferase [Euryarchaeota archaeon]|nr:ornithine carbamoyltransferase [Euryarchaeota archaeon]
MKRDVLSILDLPDLEKVLDLATEMKNGQTTGKEMTGKSLAMIFEKSSTRTRVSFEVAMTQMGGHSIFLSQNDTQLGRGETVADTARVLGRFVDAIMYRAYRHTDVLELAKHSRVPVINALDDMEHPCQIAADMLTIREHKGTLKGLKLAYVGDGNNVANSLLLACAMVGMNTSLGCPEGYTIDSNILSKATSIAKENDSLVETVTDPFVAVKDADVIYTDTWVSMGDEDQVSQRKKDLMPYQVNMKLMSAAKPDAIFMHCLPAHRGDEVTDEVMDGENSAVFDQAENRLHAQKAILRTVIND